MKTIKKIYTVKNWNELTEEEKEEQKKKNETDFFNWLEEGAHLAYEADIDFLKYQSKYFTFDALWIDDNSQGWWIEGFKNLTDDFWIDNHHVCCIDYEYSRNRRRIENITELEIDGEIKTLEDWKNTRGYKKIARDIEQDWNKLMEGINNALDNYFDNRWNYNEDSWNDFFECTDFEYLQKVEEE